MYCSYPADVMFAGSFHVLHSGQGCLLGGRDAATASSFVFHERLQRGMSESISECRAVQSGMIHIMFGLSVQRGKISY